MQRLNKIYFIGNGRWAKILIQNLLQHKNKYEITWIFRNEKSLRSNLTRSKDYIKVKFVTWNKVYSLPQPNRVIIASHSLDHSSHYKILRTRFPFAEFLIEKPLFNEFNKFQMLSEREKKKTFFNLEFMYLYEINNMGKYIAQENIESIDIYWYDPFISYRQAKREKYSEVFTSIFHDQYLHTISILIAMNLEMRNFFLIDVNKIEKNDCVKISGSLGETKINIFLSRFANERMRKLEINQGLLSIDFSDRQPKGQKTFSSRGRESTVRKTFSYFLSKKQSSRKKLHCINALNTALQLCFVTEDKFLAKYFSGQLNKFYDEEVDGYNSLNVYLNGIKYFRKMKSNKFNQSKKFIHYKVGFEAIKSLHLWSKNN